jgi:thermitase
MASPEQFESAKLRTIDVILQEGCDRAALERAVTALAGASWSIRPVAFEPTGREFDVIPPGPIEPARAWELTRKLQADPCVKDADPTFEAVYAEQDAATNEQPGGGPYLEQAAETAELGALREDDYDWSARFVQAHEAWQLPDSLATRGEGIVIGHPDSGYLRHPQLGPNFKPELGWDFIKNGKLVEDAGGSHGLSTASVISSPHDDVTISASGVPRPFVAGIAPGVHIIPLRVAKPTGFIPAPVLFDVGADRLRDAIWYAIHRRVHVISISLGWLPNAGLHRALQHAVRENIIVIAAAGNYTGPIVVWPAAYDEVIAMAACNARAKPWTFSARGRAVDATGPGENVWTAQPGDTVEKSTGTSHAAATVAGIAALWLAHHGRDRLLARYQGGPTLAQVFRQVLRESCTGWTENKDAWGAGLVNAKACLQHPLPSWTAQESSELGEGNADSVTHTFSGLPESDVQRRLARVLGVDEQKAAQLDTTYGRELRFWALTHPPFRHALQEEGAPTEAAPYEKAPEDSPLPLFSPSLRAALG